MIIITNKEKNVSKEIIINKNEVKVDMQINSDYMIFCGTCMYYCKKKECIVGISCANICVFKDYKKIKQIKTDCYGNYYVTIPRSIEYTICICKKEKKQRINLICNNSYFCMKHFIFDEENNLI